MIYRNSIADYKDQTRSKVCPSMTRNMHSFYKYSNLQLNQITIQFASKLNCVASSRIYLGNYLSSRHKGSYIKWKEIYYELSCDTMWYTDFYRDRSAFTCTFAAWLYFDFRRCPTSRNSGVAFQQVWISQLPDIPWHLHFFWTFLITA